MELKIVVDETKFKDVIEDELKAFSKEELHEIVRECIIEALKDKDMLKKMFVIKGGYYNNEEKPSQLMIEAAKSLDLSPASKEIADLMINTLKENYPKLLQQVLLQLLVDGITNNYRFQENMNQTMNMIIQNEFVRRENQ